MNTDHDVCIVGSGAGAGPVALTLAKAGYSVVILEKGPWWREEDFCKDELASGLRTVYTPDLQEQPHVVETLEETIDGPPKWQARATHNSGWNFWNGCCVGGSSNLMSAFFHRLKPVDFKLRSVFGSIDGATVEDWPIEYADLEPYYDKVEKIVGISGKVVKHPHQEPRSSVDFPYPPTAENHIAGMIDDACKTLGYYAIPTPRGILSKPAMSRQACSYNGGYCGSTGCSTGAKGSSRAALLQQAVATGRCEIRAHSMVTRLVSNHTGRITGVEYSTNIAHHQHKKQLLSAKIYVVACQAIESARLLLNSTGPKHPHGLANSSGLVGKNLLFAGGGAGSGRLLYQDFDSQTAAALADQGSFINRALQDWYIIDDPKYGAKAKGGTIDFVQAHPAPTLRAMRHMHGKNGLHWGKSLKRKIEKDFLSGPQIKIEAFCDWLPHENCSVTIDPEVKDKWGMPVARVRTGFHYHNLKVGWYLAQRGSEVLKKMGAHNVVAFASGTPPTNLVAGTCRFGNDPQQSVLNADCQAHEVENLYVTDGSFMPTGGSVPYTWTIYANAFRVAERIVKHLSG